MSAVFADLNQYFDKIYVITLEGYEARQASIKEHFDGLNYEFWPGTDKRDFSDEVLKDTTLYNDKVHRITKRTSRSMTLGEYCCSVSHRRIFEDMLEHGHERALIFEDDAIPVLSALPDFKTTMASLDQGWDLILFDYYDHYLEGFGSSVKKALYKLYHHLHIANWQHVPKHLINNITMREYNEHFYKVGKCSGAHSYAVSAKAAKHYIDMQTPVILQADRIFYYDNEPDKLKKFASKTSFFDRGDVSLVSSIQTRNGS